MAVWSSVVFILVVSLLIWSATGYLARIVRSLDWLPIVIQLVFCLGHHRIHIGNGLHPLVFIGHVIGKVIISLVIVLIIRKLIVVLFWLLLFSTLTIHMVLLDALNKLVIGPVI
jgi:hypothetical protein